jgi:hypothetical protein
MSEVVWSGELHGHVSPAHPTQENVHGLQTPLVQQVSFDLFGHILVEDNIYYLLDEVPCVWCLMCEVCPWEVGGFPQPPGR